ncbi:MAG TPA: DUF6088 family protein, partial [Spirochaetota bacterium]|nr:DUF6088 family protein [Spirochaetota bacterium]
IMKPVSSYIQDKVDRLSPGAIIRHSDFHLPPDKQMALAKTLSRMSKKGQIERLEKGLYYKPKKTAFGPVRPSEREILTAIIKEKKGYITDTAAANAIGATTQVSKEIVIASKSYQPPRKIAGLTIRYRRATIQSASASVEVLQILDSLRIIKRIPGSSVGEALTSIIAKLESLSPKTRKELVSCAKEYNPSVRALIGAIISARFASLDISFLKSSLNPLSVYKIGVSQDILPNKKDWNIQ